MLDRGADVNSTNSLGKTLVFDALDNRLTIMSCCCSIVERIRQLRPKWLVDEQCARGRA